MLRTTFLTLCGSLVAPALLNAQDLQPDNSLPTVFRVTESFVDMPDIDFGDNVLNPPPPSNPGRTQAPGDRMLYFAHGLGGARSAWGPVATHLQRKYQTRNQLLQYSDLKDESIPSLAGHVYNMLPAATAVQRDYEADPSRSMYIGHSMGGLIGYEVLRFQEDTDETLETLKYRGIVTVNTPFGGAGQTAAEGEEQVLHLMQEGCAAMTTGPLKAATAGLPWFIKIKEYENEDDLLPSGKKGIFEVTDEFVSGACVGEIFEGLLNGVVVNKALPAVAEEMDPEGDYIESLAGYQPPWEIPTARITSYEEEQPVTFRMISSGLDGPAQQEVYTANDDESFIDTHAELVATYELAAARQYALAQQEEQRCMNSGFITCWINGNKRKAEKYREAGGYYEEGVDWLENLNDAWLGIIGALDYEVVSNTYQCDCRLENQLLAEAGADADDDGEPDSYETTSAEGCVAGAPEGQVCEAIFLYANERAVYYPSDGAALLSSQVARGADVTANYTTSNHLQIRNDENTRDAFEVQLFESRNSFFNTPKRP